MWSDGSVHEVDVQGRLGFDQTVTRNNETHSLSWSNIVCNYQQNCVIRFDVKIDGKNYYFPEGRGDEPAEYKIEFILNDTSYTYLASCGYLEHPYMYYLPKTDQYAEQYNIIGSNTSDDCKENINTIIIGIVNNNGWQVNILHFNESESVYFYLAEFNISLLTNKDIAGGHVTFMISGPIQNFDGSQTISDIFVSAENLGELN
jgi:hypothetical protein